MNLITGASRLHAQEVHFLVTMVMCVTLEVSGFPLAVWWLNSM